MKSIPCNSKHEYELRVKAKKCVHDWVAYANEHMLSHEPMPMPAVRFDLLGRTAGKWVTRRDHPKHLPTLIRINADLLLRYPKEVLDQTIPHEVAHAVANYQWYGRHIQPHGDEWKSIMRALGKKPTRCHQMQTRPARKTTRYIYSCACDMPHKLSTARHKRAQSGRLYRCRRCRLPIAFTGKCESA